VIDVPVQSLDFETIRILFARPGDCSWPTMIRDIAVLPLVVVVCEPA
jgi:hypothetical protein